MKDLLLRFVILGFLLYIASLVVVGIWGDGLGGPDWLMIKVVMPMTFVWLSAFMLGLPLLMIEIEKEESDKHDGPNKS